MQPALRRLGCLLILAATISSDVVCQILAPPTWGENISCLVFSHCTPCHRPGGIAPFSLMTYEDASSNASAMAAATAVRHMPPWKPNHSLNSFQGERVLTFEEIQAMQLWAVAGAPLGDTTFTPDAPVYGKWQIEEPDFSLKLDDYVVQDRGPGNDDFVCISKDMGLTSNVFITDVEFIPGGPVHHSLISTKSDDVDTIKFCYAPESEKNIAGWAPSSSVFSLPDGMGIPVQGGRDIEVSLHYPYQAVGMLDSSRINMNLSADPSLRKVYVERAIHHSFHIVADLDSIAGSVGAPLFIPPDKVKTVWAYRLVPESFLLLSVNPHMHKLGKQITVWLMLPDLSVITLIEIDDWDPAWQGFYTYKKPVVVPAGSRIIVKAIYDNTSSNPRNPHDPPELVTVGGNADDEMLIVMGHFTQNLPGDELLYFDESTHNSNHYLECDPKASGPLKVYNPTWQSHLDFGELEVYDLTGKLVFKGWESDLNRRSLRTAPHAFVRFSGVTVEMPLQ